MSKLEFEIEKCKELIDRLTPVRAVEKNKFSMDLYCPICDNLVYELTIKKERFCSNCGQAIGWLEEYNE